MKIRISIILFFLGCNSIAQIDTIVDFKQRFYVDKVLNTSNVFEDSLKEGNWIEYFDTKWNKCNKDEHKFYRLIEYKNGFPIGKIYDFYKSGELQKVCQYKDLEKEIRTGTFIWFSKKGNKLKLKYYALDTIIEKAYYQNGNLLFENLFLRDKSLFSYANSRFYHKNGSTNTVDFYNSSMDTTYYVARRKNGTIQFQDIVSNGNLIRIEQNKNGDVTARRTVQFNSDTLHIEKFKNGQLSKVNSFYYNQNINKYFLAPDKVVNYQLSSEKNKKVNYKNNHKISEKVQQKKHWYQEFSSDSLLLYEGVFKKMNLPCGAYRANYATGMLKLTGTFDKKGRKSGFWNYYNKAGELEYSEYYEKGLKTNANIKQN